MPSKNLNEAVRANKQWFQSGPKRSERRRTTNPRYTTSDRTDDGSHEVERPTPIKAKTINLKKQQITPKQRDGMESLVTSPLSSSVPSRVPQNLDKESLTHEPDTSVCMYM